MENKSTQTSFLQAKDNILAYSQKEATLNRVCMLPPGDRLSICSQLCENNGDMK